MLELNKVYNMDCMEGMAQIPDGYFELAIVDPPYGIGECASRNNTGSRPTKKWRKPAGKTYKPFNDTEPYKEYQYKELCRVSRNRIIFGANNFDFLPSSTGWIIWDKCVSENEHLSMCELAYSSFNVRCKKFTYLWAGFKREGTNKHKEIRINHPTQKPVALYKWILKNYAKPGDKILDTHMGSGSSIIACYDMGFEYMAFEIDKDYYEAAMKRINDHKAQVQMELPTETIEQCSIL
jgi:site-specific DNA-methyltransferase (adenine-specific)